MNDQYEKALKEAYAKYLHGCEKRCAPVIWNYQEWLDGSIIAASITFQYWTVEDNK